MSLPLVGVCVFDVRCNSESIDSDLEKISWLSFSGFKHICLLTLTFGELGDLRGSRIGLRTGTRLIGLRGNAGST